MPVKISQKGWVVIPAKLRRKYNLFPGSEMHVVDYGGVLSLVPAMDDPIEEAAGMLQGDISLTQALLAEHREELRRER
ncbi:MAG: AbrB/MazE/SpoVT family DNA-binding domain-containing protein [Chloroflexota bacterium]|nr:AbrB/MazE/SpoVT family DNA-binding domain-containing protein [Chloroflexota bacterium]